MTRRRWVQIGGQLIEVTNDYSPPPRDGKTHYVSDAWMDGTRSPIDGSDIGSRTKLREHMRLHGVAHYDEVAPDAARARAEANRQHAASRTQDVVAALEMVKQGYRPQIERE